MQAFIRKTVVPDLVQDPLSNTLRPEFVEKWVPARAAARPG
jgi:hypothetical protein